MWKKKKSMENPQTYLQFIRPEVFWVCHVQVFLLIWPEDLQTKIYNCTEHKMLYWLRLPTCFSTQARHAQQTHFFIRCQSYALLFWKRRWSHSLLQLSFRNGSKWLLCRHSHETWYVLRVSLLTKRQKSPWTGGPGPVFDLGFTSG